ncbi:MAG: hypothetical protein PVH00_04710 [Gemmatimonadota bacterium]|jgi:hypothetical protein
MTGRRGRETRRIHWRGARYTFAATHGEPRAATVVSVKIDDRPVGRLEIATDLDSLSRTELAALAERVRLNAADLSRWEGEGGNPPPG